MTIERAIRVPKVSMYCSARCSYCVAAERFLVAKGVADIEKIRVDLQPERLQEMMEKTRRRTVPQIYINEVHVGGYDDLVAWDRAGRLAGLLHG